ncbi:MAG: hypothetical protein EXX96DRAFT_483410 [Benjaminiella poitrasii]|nr:MAG: hypothetical protein EXX96DRAFT_483410 [Benjaminiella poitrasii]
MNLQGAEKDIVKYIRRMVESFPYSDLGEVTTEYELRSRYILPTLQSLFDDMDDENLVVFKISNENNQERKKQFNISHSRPDGQFRQKKENEGLVTIGYLEAKAESRINSKESCMKDLVRPGIFGKNTIDIYKLNSALLVQAIGPNLTFYMLQKKSNDVYAMVELDSFNFPMNISQIPAIFGYFNRLADILAIFRKYVKCQCIVNDNSVIRKTLRSPVIRSLTIKK